MRTKRARSRTAVALAVAASAWSLAAIGTVVAQESAIDEELAASLQAIVDQLPEPQGTDGEHLISLLGLPDAFHVTFEPDEAGSIVRREEWTYYDLEAAFDLQDGAIMTDWPLEELPSVVISAPAYDPAVFTAGASWDSLADVLSEPEAFEAVSLDEYDLEATAYVGASMMLLFDENGGLFYVETLPLVFEPEAPA